MTSDKTYIVRKANGWDATNFPMAAAESAGGLNFGRAAACESALGRGGTAAGRGGGATGFCGFFGAVPRRIISWRIACCRCIVAGRGLGDAGRRAPGDCGNGGGTRGAIFGCGGCSDRPLNRAIRARTINSISSSIFAPDS